MAFLPIRAEQFAKPLFSKSHLKLQAQAIDTNQIKILTPKAGIINSSSTNLIIEYDPQNQITIKVNDKALPGNIASQKQLNPTNNLITQVWYNIPLTTGNNTITALSSNGTSAQVQIIVKASETKLEIISKGEPRAIADGRSTITIEGKITDSQGQLLSKDTMVTLTASAGKFIGADQDPDKAGFQVMARGGQFSAQLQSSREAQKVRIRAAISGISELNSQSPMPISSIPTSEIEAYTQVEFLTYLRPSLVSGVVNLRIGSPGTNYWGSLTNFLNPDTINKGTQIDLNGAVFATGKLGEWLFKGAYNSSRPLNQTCDGITALFQGPQACTQNYPVYGDSSTVEYLTPSTDSLFLRLERASSSPGAEPDYFMWGDYNTSELARASQLFSATTRSLHGFKGNYSFGNLQITALYSNNLQGFQRDTIAPDGTSGYYFVSHRLMIEGSENVFIESEEINRPGTVIERKPLYRGTDYEIDYERGTLMFRNPVLATEYNPFGVTLVHHIIVTYQYQGGSGNNTNLYAGRLQYNFSQNLNRPSLAGISYLREDLGIQNFELYGADFLFPLGKDGRLVGEYAVSRNQNISLGDVSGAAYRLEFSANLTPFLQAQAFYRSVDANFANNATASFSPGQTRYGGAIAAKITPSTNLTASYEREKNFGTALAAQTQFFDVFNPQPQPTPGSPVDNQLTTIRAGLQQKIGNSRLSIDYVNRFREDRINNVLQGNTSQIVSQLNIPIANNLAFRAQNEFNLDRNDPLYPDRTTVGLDWKVYQGTTVRLAHQFINGGLLGTNSITSLDTVSEYKLAENTSITSRYSILNGYNGFTTQGALGIKQGLILAPGLRLDLGYERIASDILNSTAAGNTFAQPYAVGQTAASLGLLSGETYNVGIAYTDNPNFKASARFEKHTGSSNDNTVITGNVAGKLTPSLTALLQYQQANFANQLIRGLGDSATLKVGLAYRDPADDTFNGLLHYEFRQNPATIPDTLLIGTGTGSTEHFFSVEGIYSPSWQWEFYGKYAMRYSLTNLASNFSNSSTISLTQLRATYRLGYQMDLAAEARWISQSLVGYDEIGWALEAGYYLIPNLRLYLGYSFGSVDDKDFTGYRSNGGVYFGVTVKLNELFDGFGQQRMKLPKIKEPDPNKLIGSQGILPTEINKYQNVSVPTIFNDPSATLQK